MKSANAPSPVEMEVNVLARASVSAPKVTKETSVPSPSVSLAAVHMGLAMNPTNANVKKAGTADTAIKGMEPASCMP